MVTGLTSAQRPGIRVVSMHVVIHLSLSSRKIDSPTFGAGLFLYQGPVRDPPSSFYDMLVERHTVLVGLCRNHLSVCRRDEPSVVSLGSYLWGFESTSYTVSTGWLPVPDSTRTTVSESPTTRHDVSERGRTVERRRPTCHTIVPLLTETSVFFDPS